MNSDIDRVDTDLDDETGTETVEEPLSEIDRLRNDLDECRTQLFALLNQDEQVSEGSIEKEYYEISDAIDTWVREVFGESTTFRNTLNRNLKDRKTRRQLKEAGLEPASPHFEQILKAETCRLLVPSRLIWSYLRERIFQEPYPIGLSEQHYRTISKAEEVMERRSSGEYGALRVDRWRSESLTALTTSGDFQAGRKKHCDRISDGLNEALRKWVGRSISEAGWSDAHNKIIMRSIELQYILSTSFRRYVLVDSGVQPRTTPEALTDFEYKRLETWNRVSPRNVEAIIQTLSPSLVRLGRAGKAQVTLVKAVLIACTPSTLMCTSPERRVDRATSEAVSHTQRSNTYRFDSGPCLRKAFRRHKLADSRSSSSSCERPRRTKSSTDNAQTDERRHYDDERSFRGRRSSTFPQVVQSSEQDNQGSGGHENEHEHGNESPSISESKISAEPSYHIRYISRIVEHSATDPTMNNPGYTRSPPKGRLG